MENAFLVIFKDHTFKLILDQECIEHVALCYSYLDDCGNYLLDPNVLDIVAVDDINKYVDLYNKCPEYRNSLCSFLGIEAPSKFSVCFGVGKPECYFCPCYSKR